MIKSCSVLWDQDDAWPQCGVNPYSNVLSSDTDGASFESMQHEERIMLWE